MDKASLYKSNIIEHYKSPRNAGRISSPTHNSHVANASCGDEVDLYLEIKDGIVVNIKHESRGCAISVASMSILTEQLIGKSVDDLKTLSEADVLKNLGMDHGHGRLKCALVAYKAVKEALEGDVQKHQHNKVF